MLADCWSVCPGNITFCGAYLNILSLKYLKYLKSNILRWQMSYKRWKACRDPNSLQLPAPPDGILRQLRAWRSLEVFIQADRGYVHHVYWFLYRFSLWSSGMHGFKHLCSLKLNLNLIRRCRHGNIYIFIISISKSDKTLEKKSWQSL